MPCRCRKGLCVDAGAAAPLRPVLDPNPSAQDPQIIHHVDDLQYLLIDDWDFSIVHLRARPSWRWSGRGKSARPRSPAGAGIRPRWTCCRAHLESLAGRLEVVELTPFSIAVQVGFDSADPLWLRGGFPRMPTLPAATATA